MYYNSPCMLSMGIASTVRAVLSVHVVWCAYDGIGVGTDCRFCDIKCTPQSEIRRQN